MEGLDSVENIKREFEKLNYMSKGEQHLIIALRMIGKTEGKTLRKMGIYDSPRFFEAIRNLENAGWVKRSYKKNSTCRSAPLSVFELTKKGKIFNSYLLTHPEYTEISEKIPKELIIPFGK